MPTKQDVLDRLAEGRARQRAEAAVRRRQAIEDVEFMARNGAREDEAARRLGRTPPALQELLRREGRKDLWEQLTTWRKTPPPDEWERELQAKRRGPRRR